MTGYSHSFGWTREKFWIFRFLSSNSAFVAVVTLIICTVHCTLFQALRLAFSSLVIFVSQMPQSSNYLRSQATLLVGNFFMFYPLYFPTIDFMICSCVSNSFSFSVWTTVFVTNEEIQWKQWKYSRNIEHNVDQLIGNYNGYLLCFRTQSLNNFFHLNPSVSVIQTIFGQILMCLTLRQHWMSIKSNNNECTGFIAGFLLKVGSHCFHQNTAGKMEIHCTAVTVFGISKLRNCFHFSSKTYYYIENNLTRI